MSIHVRTTTLATVAAMTLGLVGCAPRATTVDDDRGARAMTERRDDARISSSMIRDAQREWSRGLVAIGAADDPVGEARRVVDRLYDYDGRGTLFKPTLTYGDRTFRHSRDNAVAYFAGGNPDYPSDTGFALRPWTDVRFRESRTIVDGRYAFYQGNMTVTDAEGASATVDKTFVYRLDDDGRLRIMVHHSSLPFQPEELDDKLEGNG